MKQTRFEVRRDGRVMACTEHKECIPPRERRDELPEPYRREYERIMI